MDLLHAELLANCLLIKHGLRDWNFNFDNAKKRFGLCSYKRKSIFLSKDLTALNEEAHVKNCLLHEIAHALTPIGAHHNHEWQKIALSIGCTGQRCYDSKIIKRPPAKHIYQCSNCNCTFEKFRRLKRYKEILHIPAGLRGH